jgi:hypothetical protein
LILIKYRLNTRTIQAKCQIQFALSFPIAFTQSSQKRVQKIRIDRRDLKTSQTEAAKKQKRNFFLPILPTVDSTRSPFLVPAVDSTR